MNCKQREIILVPFPYSDLSSSKKRPVLVVSNNQYNKLFDDVVVCVITSNTRMDNYSLEISDNDLEIGTMPEPSVIKTHKLFTIHKSRVLKKFSSVEEKFFEKVRKKIHELVESR